MGGKLKLMLINFHEGDTPPMDDDNMVKAIRDPLNQFVYRDDRQIRYSETIQVCIDDPLKLRGASMLLLTALNVGDQFLYARIENVPAVIQLPR